MALKPYVPGPVKVQVNLRSGASGSWEDLGWTLDGVTPVENRFFRDIYSDRQGGPEGPPIDKIYLGLSARIPLQMVEYDIDLIHAMRDVLTSTAKAPSSRGQIENIGTMLRNEGASIQLLLIGDLDAAAIVADSGTTEVVTPLNYPNCMIDGPLEIPTGTKNTIYGMEVTALPFKNNSGNTYLYTTDQTAIDDLDTYSP